MPKMAVGLDSMFWVDAPRPEDDPEAFMAAAVAALKTRIEEGNLQFQIDEEQDDES